MACDPTLVENKPKVHPKSTGMKMNRYLCFIPVLLGLMESMDEP